MKIADIDAVASLAGHPALSIFAAPGDVDAPLLTAEYVGANFARRHSESFVALAGSDEIVGYAYARMRKKLLWLDRMLVLGSQGKELASALLQAIVVNYVGEPSISVDIDIDDEAVFRFYAAQGFEVANDAVYDGRRVLRRLISRA